MGESAVPYCALRNEVQGVSHHNRHLSMTTNWQDMTYSLSAAPLWPCSLCFRVAHPRRPIQCLTNASVEWLGTKAKGFGCREWRKYDYFRQSDAVRSRHRSLRREKSSAGPRCHLGLPCGGNPAALSPQRRFFSGRFPQSWTSEAVGIRSLTDHANRHAALSACGEICGMARCSAVPSKLFIRYRAPCNRFGRSHVRAVTPSRRTVQAVPDSQCPRSSIRDIMDSRLDQPVVRRCRSNLFSLFHRVRLLVVCALAQTWSASQYAVSLAAAATAVLFWEQALAIPAWLLLLWLFFLKSSLRRTLLSILPFVGITAAFTAYVQSQPWHQPLAIPTVSLFITMTTAMLFRGSFPTIIGTGSGTDHGWELVSMALAPLILFAGVVVLWIVGRLRIRAIGFFVCGTLIVAATIAATRVTVIGDTAGTTSRYITLMPFVLAVTCAGAIGAGSPHRRRAPAFVPVLGLAALLALYFVNLTATYHRLNSGQEWGHEATAMAGKIGRQIDGAHAAPTSWVDSTMQWPIWFPWPSTGFGITSGYWSTDINALGQGTDLVGFDSQGVVRHARFQEIPASSAASGFYVRLTVTPGKPGTIAVTASAPTGPIVTDLVVGPNRTSFVLPTGTSQRAGVHISLVGTRQIDEQIGVVSFGSEVRR